MFIEPSNTAGEIRSAFDIVTVMCVVLLVMVTVTMLAFLFKYNSKKNARASEVKDSIPLEITWTIVPTILVLIMFYFGWVNFGHIRNAPKNAMAINVIGRQWQWSFQYQNGKGSDVLRVPVGKPVKLEMTSEDVIHSFFIPAFRIKEDCVPGMKTHLWFTADEPGTFDIFCTEYCGLGHSHMRSKLIAMKDSDFEEWYEAEAKAAKTPVSKGRELVESKGCLGCHTTDGTRKVGPTFKGLYGSTVTVVTGGKERTITADDEYIERSIKHPQADVVKGYPPVMPTLPVTDEEIEDIVSYMKTLK